MCLKRNEYMNKKNLKQLNDDHNSVFYKQIAATLLAVLLSIGIHTGFFGSFLFFMVYVYVMVALIPILMPCLFLIKGLFTGDKESFLLTKATAVGAIPAVILFIFF